ncbi:hypothetical protein ACFFGH_02000 [Lysobacter korlensis]|uniref:Uncharacterized protein n=1 Tax=Lysobacter korlensis TaxID=553636 RepID=A0ABV6RI12_9GAMM
MNPNRILLGWACIALAFVVVVLLATGLVDPPGLGNVRSSSDLLMLFVSALLVPLLLFAFGLWLIKGPRRR